MGRYHRAKPARLAEKLSQIRRVLGLSQNQMLKHLGLSDELTRGAFLVMNWAQENQVCRPYCGTPGSSVFVSNI